MVKVLLHFLLWIGFTSAIGLLHLRWSRRLDVDTRWVVRSGLLMSVIMTGIYIVGHFAPTFKVFSLGWSDVRVGREIEFYIIWGAVWTVGLIAGWRILELMAYDSQIRQLRATSWGEAFGELALTGPEEVRRIERLRLGLQKKLRVDAKNDRIVLRWSAKIQLPFTVGYRNPEIYSPQWTIAESNGEHMVPLLLHEVHHVQLGHLLGSEILRRLQILIPSFKPLFMGVRLAFEVESDREVISGENELVRERYFRALNQVVKSASGSGEEVGLGHDRSNVARRIQQCVTSPRKRILYCAGSIILIILMWCGSQMVGPVDGRYLKDLALRRLPANYEVHGCEGAKVKSIPGQGGIFEDGIVVDTTKSPSKSFTTIGLTRSHSTTVKWPGFEGSLIIRVLEKNCDSNLIVEGIAYERSTMANSKGRMIAYISDVQCQNVFTSGMVITRIHSEPSLPRLPFRKCEMYWSVRIPNGWKVEISKIDLKESKGTGRCVAEIEKTLEQREYESKYMPQVQNMTMNWGINKIYEMKQ